MCTRLIVSAVTAAIFWVVFALASPAAPLPHRHGYDATPAESCNDLHIRMDDREPALQAEERTLTLAEAPALRVHAEHNGGAQVSGWDKDTYQVTACKFASGSSAEAQKLFSQMKLTIQGGDVSVSGPRDARDWTVFLLVHTPKSAEVAVDAHNGPLSLYDLSGKLTAEVVNGPISVKDCTGDAEIRATNGPVSVTGSGGNLRLHTTNGPIDVNLRDTAWHRGELVADAQNGPVALRVPDGFQSSFLVESLGHGPVSCKSSICSQARKTWDDADRKKIEYGPGPAVIHISSVNGPVAVD